jgi:hypothetical protein
MGRVATLLSHFYVSQMSEHEARAVAQDWADALLEFPQWAVDEACREWLRTQERKPTIAGIRKLCQQHFAIVECTRYKAMRGPIARGEPVEPRETVSPERRAKMAAEIAKVSERMRKKCVSDRGPRA